MDQRPPRPSWARGIFTYATESEWRRSNRRAYYYMARGMWKQSLWLHALRFMAIFVAMTAAVFILRREIPTLHEMRRSSR